MFWLKTWCARTPTLIRQVPQQHQHALADASPAPSTTVHTAHRTAYATQRNSRPPLAAQPAGTSAPARIRCCTAHVSTVPTLCKWTYTLPCPAFPVLLTGQVLQHQHARRAVLPVHLGCAGPRGISAEVAPAGKHVREVVHVALSEHQLNSSLGTRRAPLHVAHKSCAQTLTDTAMQHAHSVTLVSRTRVQHITRRSNAASEPACVAPFNTEPCERCIPQSVLLYTLGADSCTCTRGWN